MPREGLGSGTGMLFKDAGGRQNPALSCLDRQPGVTAADTSLPRTESLLREVDLLIVTKGPGRPVFGKRSSTGGGRRSF